MANYTSTIPVHFTVVPTSSTAWSLVLASATSGSPTLGPTDNVIVDTTGSTVAVQVDSSDPGAVVTSASATSISSSPSVSFSQSGSTFVATFPAQSGTPYSWQIDVTADLISGPTVLDPILIIRKTN